ncbi:MAG: hypothetical protein IJU48_08200 [Synergistaceae bacterium]|nr:hypothetical protein [Synergistaceae bacterium]
MRKILVLFMIIMISCSPAECAKSKKSSRPKTQTQAPAQQAGFYSLTGVWSVSDALGTAVDPRQPGVDIEIIAEKFTFTIEEVKFYESSGEGTANIIYKCTIVDTRGNILNQRTWEYAVPYDVKRESSDKWIFTSEYLNGEDKITVMLKSSKTAEIRFEGMNFDETYPEDKYTFDVTCEAVKK